MPVKLTETKKYSFVGFFNILGRITVRQLVSIRTHTGCNGFLTAAVDGLSPCFFAYKPNGRKGINMSKCRDEILAGEK